MFFCMKYSSSDFPISITMAVRCSAKQIADFVVLWGMTGTFPEYCEYAEDARRLKSLDLIISTLDIFVDAFCFNFEDIYRKYKVDFPLPEEKFIKFLKPRCLLLTKDNKCFNFVLVCAFVCDIIHSFSHYNECFHLVRVTSKCLAAILQNRFKKIFEIDSDWEELMSFCLKIHCLVYPSEKINESDGNQLVEVMAEKMDSSFPNMVQGLAECSKEKDATEDNNNDPDTKTAGQKSSTSSQSDLTPVIEGEELEDLCTLEFPASTGAPDTLQLTAESSSLKSENEENTPVENNTREDNDKYCITDSSLPDFSKEFSGEKVSITNNKEITQKFDNRTNLILSFEDYSANKKVIEKLEELCHLGLASTDLPHTQLKVGDSSPKETEDKENVFDGHDAREDNETNCTTDGTNSYSPKLAKEFTTIVDDKKSLNNNNNKEENEKLDQMTGLKKNLILPFENYLEIRKVIERLEDLCNQGLPSTNSSSKDIEKINYVKKDSEKDYATDLTDSCLPELAKKYPDIFSNKTVINNTKDNTKIIDDISGVEKNLTPSFEDNLAIRGRLEDLCNLELTSADAPHTQPSHLKDGYSSPKKEKICYENDEKNDIEKDCVRDITDSSVGYLGEDNKNCTINYKDKGIEKLGQMIGFKKRLILSFGKDLPIKKEPEKFQLCNLEPDSSTGESHAFQMKYEDFSSNAESEDKEKVVGESNATGSLVPDLAHEITNLSVEKVVINKNLNNLKMIDSRKKLTLSFTKDSSVQKATKTLAGLNNLETAYSIDKSHTLQLKDKEFSSKNESEDNNEPFNIRCMPADKIRARITDNPQQLSEIMNLLKKCEEDIQPNLFSPDEYNISINDSEEDGELEASGGTPESSSNSDQTIFEATIKAVVFVQNMKVAHSINRIFLEDNPSDDESPTKASVDELPHEMSDEVTYMCYTFEHSNLKIPRCPLCAGGMIDFFDTCVHNFATKYSNNSQVTDLITLDFHDDSE